MKRTDIRKSVHEFVSLRLDDHQAFADDVACEQQRAEGDDYYCRAGF